MAKHMRKEEIIFNYLLLKSLIYNLTCKSSYAYQLLFVIIALCGVTCLCRHMHPKKGVLQRDLEPDPEKAKPSVLRAAQQVSGRGPRPPRGLGGVSPWRLRRGEWMGRNGW